MLGARTPAARPGAPPLLPVPPGPLSPRLPRPTPPPASRLQLIFSFFSRKIKGESERAAGLGSGALPAQRSSRRSRPAAPNPLPAPAGRAEEVALRGGTGARPAAGKSASSPPAPAGALAPRGPSRLPDPGVEGDRGWETGRGAPPQVRCSHGNFGAGAGRAAGSDGGSGRRGRTRRRAGRAVSPGGTESRGRWKAAREPRLPPGHRALSQPDTPPLPPAPSRSPRCRP